MSSSCRTSDAPAWEKVTDHPAWAPYRPYLERLPSDRFPAASDFDALLPPGTRTSTPGGAGAIVRFLPPAELPEPVGEAGYEREIAASGRVSTRPGDLHDVCNALVWARFPRLKATLNRRHLEALPGSRRGRRGPVRDALTLFDECGLVIAGTDRAPLEALARHDWTALFGAAGECWPAGLATWVVGHANLEKLFQPYKAMTGHCLLLQAEVGVVNDPDRLDAALADLWSSGGPMDSPGALCPLPFMGIPGWWPGRQDANFYADPGVFRPPRAGRAVPSVLSWPEDSSLSPSLRNGR